MANWVEFRRKSGGKIWINLDLATVIRAGSPPYKDATAVVVPGEPEILVEEDGPTVFGKAQNNA